MNKTHLWSRLLPSGHRLIGELYTDDNSMRLRISVRGAPGTRERFITGQYVRTIEDANRAFEAEFNKHRNRMLARSRGWKPPSGQAGTKFL